MSSFIQSAIVFAILNLIPTLIAELAHGNDQLSELTELIEVSSSLWPEGEMHCTMTTMGKTNDIKIWWMGSLCRREVVDLSPDSDREVTIHFSDTRVRTYYHEKISTVYIFPISRRPEEVAWTRAKPSECWTEIRSFVSVASWWHECLNEHRVTLDKESKDVFRVLIKKDGLKAFPVVFNKFGLLVQLGERLDHPDNLGSLTIVNWQPVGDGPPHPKDYITKIRSAGDDVASIYRKIEVKSFSAKLKSGHPPLRLRENDLPIGTFILDHRGNESRRYVGGEAGKQQFRINHLARKLKEVKGDP